MERDEAMGRLTRAHALALRLRSIGADDRLIAEVLEIEPEGVGPLLTIATTKLAELAEDR